MENFKTRTPEEQKEDLIREFDMLLHAIDPLCEYPMIKACLKAVLEEATNGKG